MSHSPLLLWRSAEAAAAAVAPAGGSCKHARLAVRQRRDWTEPLLNEIKISCLLRVTDATRGLSKKSPCSSSSSIHLLYNHAPTQALSSSPGQRTALAKFNCPEVVHYLFVRRYDQELALRTMHLFVGILILLAGTQYFLLRCMVPSRFRPPPMS